MITMLTTPLIDPALTVNEVLRRWPAAVGAMNSLGIDTCCGGADSLAVAASQLGLPLADVITVITDAIMAARRAS